MKYNPYIFILLIMLLPLQGMAGECSNNEGCVSECPELQPIPGVKYDLALTIRTDRCRETGTNDQCECKKSVCEVRKKYKDWMCRPCYYDSGRGMYRPLGDNKEFKDNLLTICVEQRLLVIENERKTCRQNAHSVANDCVLIQRKTKQECDKELKDALNNCDAVALANGEKVIDQCNNAFEDGVPLTCRPVGVGTQSSWEQWSTPE